MRFPRKIRGPTDLGPTNLGVNSLEPLEVALMAARAAEVRKAIDVMVMEVRDLTVVADYFVLASGRTPTQVKALAEHVEEELARAGVRVGHREGYERGRWILLDFGDVIVHLMCEQERAFYSLERLWGDAPVVFTAGEMVADRATESGS